TGSDGSTFTLSLSDETAASNGDDYTFAVTGNGAGNNGSASVASGATFKTADTITATFANDGSNSSLTVAGTGSVTYSAVVDGTDAKKYNVTGSDGSTFTLSLSDETASSDGDDYTFTVASGTDTFSGDVTFNNETVAVNSDGTATFANSGVTIDFANASSGAASSTVVVSNATTTTTPGTAFSADLQIGANTGQSFNININDMRGAALGISEATGGSTTVTSTSDPTVTATYTTATEVTDGTSNSGTEKALDVSTHQNATAAITIIDDAINKVSAERSKLGAYQNRLDHTINNLGTSSENLTAAESRIRDVDMAKEMMTQTKNSILSQAAQAMLAQANQQPQGVLQLLR
ncbi:flagellin, partial [Ureibacillus composti]